MSYNEGTYVTNANGSLTPMIYDIAAVQYMYGANMSTNAGNTTHTLDGSQVAKTIWDASGTDLLTSGSYSGGVTLDLRE
ncbi:hypothetical protein P6O83_15980, partial [Clostridium perfringens]|nr:hypothetical protein [Clostridium perfringens]